MNLLLAMIVSAALFAFVAGVLLTATFTKALL